jgi:membrane-associated protein
MELLHHGLDLFLHLNTHINTFAGHHPVGVYVLIFAIVFCETGLVVTPFLPGDSLLFAIGALAAATASPISLPLAILLLCLAANCGDVLNYAIGRRLGPAVFSRDSFLLSKKHLIEAQEFYEKHGRMTIVMARFVPIIRTFAPFVAGIGRMEFGRFIGFSIGGGALWVLLLTLAGYFFGQIPVVQKNFEIVILAIVVISVLPGIVHLVQSKAKKPAAVEPATVGGSEAAAIPAPIEENRA